MGTANFFDRALMSAVQALQGGDPSQIQSRLEAQTVELAFDGTAAVRLEGQFSLDLTVRLLARLYPKLRLTALDSVAEPLVDQLTHLAHAINPALDLTSPDTSTVRLVFGGTLMPEGPSTVYAGSDGWLAKASTEGPRGVGRTDLPFGAGGAACLGAANVFRSIFADAVPSARLDEDATLSMYDFTTGSTATQGPEEPHIDVGLTSLIGLGAIGNGVIWALARTARLAADLHLVDPEPVELSNLQRYVLTLQTDVGRVKVELARDALLASASAMTATPLTARWDEYLAARGHAPMQRVLTALDSAEDRIAVQASLPARILNAWTQTGDLGISQHDFLGGEACLACLYLPKGSVPNQDEVIAHALGLPLDLPVLLDLRERLVNGQPVGEAFVRETAARVGVVPDALLPFAGEPLRQFYAKAVCGSQLLPLQVGRPAVEAPLAFQSAMAGIMLASNLVVEAGALRAAPLQTTTIIDLMRPLGQRLGVSILKPDRSATVRCICQDQDFVAAYLHKHGQALNRDLEVSV